MCGPTRTESKLSGVRTTTSAASTHAASAASSAITTKRAIVYVFLSVLLFKPRTAHRRAPNQHSAPSPRLCACAPMGHRASTSLSHHHARPCPPPTSPPTSPGPRPPYPTARLAYPIYPYSASCLSPYIPRDLALRDHRDRRPSGAPTSSFLPSTSQSMESTLRWGSPQTQPDGEPQFVVALRLELDRP